MITGGIDALHTESESYEFKIMRAGMKVNKICI